MKSNKNEKDQLQETLSKNNRFITYIRKIAFKMTADNKGHLYLVCTLTIEIKAS